MENKEQAEKGTQEGNFTVNRFGKRKYLKKRGSGRGWYMSNLPVPKKGA